MKSLVFFIILGISAVSAQEQRTLTLAGAVDIARQRNVSVIQARNTVDASRTGVWAAYGGLLPTVTASGNYGTGTTWQSGFEQQTSTNYSAGVSARMTIFNGFSNTANVNRAVASSSAFEYSATRTEHSTIYTTHQLFLNVVRTFQLLKVTDDNLKWSKRQLERISESNKVGAVALADVYRQQVQVGSDELALIQAQSNHEKSKQDLMAFLGVDFDAVYTFDFAGIPEDIDTTEFATVNAQYTNFQELVANALKFRPDYLSATENLNSASSSVTMAQSGHLPTVSASGSYGYSGYPEGDDPTQYTPRGDFRSLRFGIDVSFPIFSGFSTVYQVEQAQVQKKNAAEELRQAERQVIVDIRKALLDLESAEKQVAVTRTSVASADMDRQIAEEKYNLGAGTLLDLLIANANYTTALSNKVNAAVGYLLAKKGVELAAGTISE